MNDINRRGFLGTLAAAVTALFVGKRTEASANDLDKHVEQPTFQRGDIVLFDGVDNAFCGVVIDWTPFEEGDGGYYTVDTPHGLISGQGVTWKKISYVDSLKPGEWCGFTGPRKGGDTWVHESAILCKPTQSVKAGQWLIHLPELGSRIEAAAHWHSRSVYTTLGFAASDVTVSTGSFISGQTARWEEHPRDWCWVVPQLAWKEGDPVVPGQWPFNGTV